MSTPTKGRIVHYRGQGNEAPMAAIVVYVHDDTRVNLTVFTEDGATRPQANVPLIEGDPAEWPGPGWEWPPLVAARTMVAVDEPEPQPDDGHEFRSDRGGVNCLTCRQPHAPVPTKSVAKPPAKKRRTASAKK